MLEFPCTIPVYPVDDVDKLLWMLQVGYRCRISKHLSDLSFVLQPCHFLVVNAEREVYADCMCVPEKFYSVKQVMDDFENEYGMARTPEIVILERRLCDLEKRMSVLEYKAEKK